MCKNQKCFEKYPFLINVANLFCILKELFNILFMAPFLHFQTLSESLHLEKISCIKANGRAQLPKTCSFFGYFSQLCIAQKKMHFRARP